MKAEHGIFPSPRVYIETDFEIFPTPRDYMIADLGIFPSPIAYIEGKRSKIFQSPRDLLAKHRA